VKIYRRRFLQSATAFVVTATPGLVRAQAWPARPVRIIVGFAPGGALDVVARLIGAAGRPRLPTWSADNCR
jgi:tripartite-type tricarboxylate transporter receptor subunit TctC